MSYPTSCALSKPWDLSAPAAFLGACLRTWRDGFSRFIGALQAGIWPWFGSADAMDDMMPWGRGTFASRPSSDSPGNGAPSEPDPAHSRAAPFYHLPVLLLEVVQYLEPAPGKLIFDGTLGGGGHSEALLQCGARIVAMDQDVNALHHAAERLRPYADRFCALRGNFRDFPQVLGEAGITGLDGMLIDIGVSSHHLDAAERGRGVGGEVGVA
ncbi:MAG: 16S rRNA (cytosine(1402)-N(4))-methyltransferase, partial [Prosthecobacter sp.]|nr:16S rRNA (cytosine(1402)-N(4))-methyltransferase [Prosthecobacter sp.]